MTTHLPFAFPIRVPDDVLVAFGEPAAAPSESGHQWKELFLPDGTRLRASFGRKQYFAVVAGADIKYGEHAVAVVLCESVRQRQPQCVEGGVAAPSGQ